jgi:hypothetical protein
MDTTITLSLVVLMALQLSVPQFAYADLGTDIQNIVNSSISIACSLKTAAVAEKEGCPSPVSFPHDQVTEIVLIVHAARALFSCRDTNIIHLICRCVAASSFCPCSWSQAQQPNPACANGQVQKSYSSLRPPTEFTPPLCLSSMFSIPSICLIYLLTLLLIILQRGRTALRRP